MIVLDTDHVSVLQHSDSTLAERCRTRVESHSSDDVTTTAITLEEQTRSWLGLIRRYKETQRQVPYYERLVDMFRFFADWRVLPFDQRAAERFDDLRRQRIRIGTMDLKIASISLVNDATLLSANLRDFEQVPGLKAENWLAN